MIKIPFSLCLIGVLFISQTIFSQDYNVSNIPEDIKKNAYAVVRKDNTVCEVLSNNSLRIKKHFAITIFDKSGDFLNSFREYYDNNEKITAANAVFYNSSGKKINSFRMKDFDDYSAINGFSLFEDNRVLTFSPNINSYPYTVEYESTTIEKEYISLHNWLPVPYENVGIQSSQLTIIVPEDYALKYKIFNLDNDFKIDHESGKTIYNISIKDFPVLEDEPYSPSWENYVPHVRIVPQNFSMEKFAGSYSSWKDFGTWVYDLKAGKDVLPEEVELELTNKLSGIEDQKEKILTLYKHLQNTTRYVNISYGIGGYQPYSATTVNDNGYGDCKALSNYMYSMLKIFGINSIYTLIYAGSGKSDIITDFPSQQFNHVILCVPNSGDTIWLECTSQTTPPGFLSSFTSDRTVLFIDEEGGRLARTKNYSPEENLQLRKAIVDFDNTGSELIAKIDTKYKGQRYSIVENLIHQSAKDQKDHLLKTIAIPQFTLNNFTINNDFDDLAPIGFIKLDLKIQNYMTQGGNRFFLPLNLMNKYGSVPKSISDRKNDLFISNSFHLIDSVCFHLPENLSMEYLPEIVELTEDFGEYRFQCTLSENNILAVRDFKIKKGTYPKETYAEFVNFLNEINKADNSKALLLINK